MRKILPDFINSIADSIFKKNYKYTSNNSFVIYDLPVDNSDDKVHVEVTVKIINLKEY